MAVTHPYDLVILDKNKLLVNKSSKLDLIIVEKNNIK